MKILTYPKDKSLRHVSTDVKFNNEKFDLNELCINMSNIMKENNGIGLAAPQVGVNKNIFIYDEGLCLGEESRIVYVINPKLEPIEHLGTNINYEACLSIPGKQGKVERYTGVDLHYYDVSGTLEYRKLYNYASRVVQHEYQHLNGILYFDNMLFGYNTLEEIHKPGIN